MVYSFLTHRRETKLKAQTDPFSVNGEKRRGKKKKKTRISGNTGSANWSLVRAIEEAMQHGIWGRYRERITCCIRNDGVGATRVTVRRLFRSSGGGVETTLDRSCSGQRVAISLRMSRNRATFASSSVKTPPIALKGSSFLKTEPCFPHPVSRLSLR